MTTLHVYRLRKAAILVWCSVALVGGFQGAAMIGILLSEGLTGGLIVAPSIAAVAGFACGILALSTALRTGIITSSEGTEYRRAIFAMRFPWASVLRLADTPVRRNRDIETLIVAVPAMTRLAAALWWLSTWSWRDKIALDQFDSHWREGPLGDDLRRYAPHLFDEGDWPDP